MWLEEQDIYDISVIEDDENTGYKKTFYERNPEKEASDEFYDSEDTSYINFQGLVYVGDIIRSTNSFRETVTEVSFDGSFYTETEMTGLYVDEETDLDFFDEETMYDDDSSDTGIGSGQYVYEYDMVDGSHLYLCGSELSVPPTTIYIVAADGKTTQIKKFMENIRGYRDDMLLFHAIIKKNINFLRRSSKKDDFIIENILEGVNIIDDIRIIELYFERNEQAIKETDIKYGKLCHKLSYNVLNNRQDSEECVNTTYLEVWNRIPPTRPAKFKAYISIIVRDISIDKLRHLTAKKRSADMVMALDELTEILPDERHAPGRNDEEIGKLLSIFLRKQKEEVQRVFVLKYFYFESNRAIAEKYGFTERKVTNMLARTRNKLKKYLIEEGIYI